MAAVRPVMRLRCLSSRIWRRRQKPLARVEQAAMCAGCGLGRSHLPFMVHWIPSWSASTFACTFAARCPGSPPSPARAASPASGAGMTPVVSACPSCQRHARGGGHLVHLAAKVRVKVEKRSASGPRKKDQRRYPRSLNLCLVSASLPATGRPLAATGVAGSGELGRGRRTAAACPRSHRSAADGNALGRPSDDMQAAGAENAVTRVPQGSPGTRVGSQRARRGSRGGGRTGVSRAGR